MNGSELETYASFLSLSYPTDGNRVQSTKCSSQKSEGGESGRERERRKRFHSYFILMYKKVEAILHITLWGVQVQKL